MRRSLTKLLLFLSVLVADAQMQIGFRMPEQSDRIDITFESINNLVIVPILVNDFLKLDFVIDTGVDTPILLEPAYAPLLDIEFFREITISGAGVEGSIDTMVAKGVTFEFQGGVVGKNLNLLVLKEDFLKLSERMGRDIHGIIGYDLFKDFTIELNYDTKVMRLHRKGQFKPRKRMISLPMKLDGSKAYVHAQIQNSSDSIKLLIDSGASHSLLIDASQTSIKKPEKTISSRLGIGLGGSIMGELGRLQDVNIGSFHFHDVLISMPNENGYSKSIKRGARQGTLGSEILSRLNPVIDYGNERIYFSKSNSFKDEFDVDMSGVDIILKGPFLDTMVVDYVRKNSPASHVDIRVDDIIQSINGINNNVIHATNTTNAMGYVNALLKSRPNRKIKFKILRNGEKLKKEIRLKRQI